MVTAVIPCGGQGTRIAAVARGLPKELLPVAGKPLLEWTLAEAAAAGLTRAVVVSSPDKAPALEAHVTARPPAGLSAVVVLQPQPRGLGDAITCARAAVGTDDVALLLPDNLFARGPAILPVLDARRRTGRAAVLLAEIRARDAATKGATGRVRCRARPDGLLDVEDLADKGAKGGRFDPGDAPSALTAIGRMAFGPDIFDLLEDIRGTQAADADLDDVPALQRLARGGRLVGVLAAGPFYDVGVPEGYADALARLT
ncbi:MAG TPA: sugar phosphate nucleotidyltransferase [Gemmatimonadales bacterium]|nr:sugar phosphate nucleotidyltransferase [Gemmatimonadales bacterium]